MNNKVDFGKLKRFFNTNMIDNTNVGKYIPQEIIDRLSARAFSTPHPRYSISAKIDEEVDPIKAEFSSITLGDDSTNTTLEINSKKHQVFLRSRYTKYNSSKEFGDLYVNVDGSELFINLDGSFVKKGHKLKVLDKTQTYSKIKQDEFHAPVRLGEW